MGLFNLLGSGSEGDDDIWYHHITVESKKMRLRMLLGKMYNCDMFLFE